MATFRDLADKHGWPFVITLMIPIVVLSVVVVLLAFAFESWVVQRLWAWHLTAWAPTPKLVEVMVANLILSTLLTVYTKRTSEEQAASFGASLVRAGFLLLVGYGLTFL